MKGIIFFLLLLKLLDSYVSYRSKDNKFLKEMNSLEKTEMKSLIVRNRSQTVRPQLHFVLQHLFQKSLEA